MIVNYIKKTLTPIKHSFNYGLNLAHRGFCILSVIICLILLIPIRFLIKLIYVTYKRMDYYDEKFEKKVWPFGKF